MLIPLAWKNTWRKPLRSCILISAIFTGIFLGLFISAFVNGLAKQRLSNQLNNTLAPIKISHQKFMREKPIQHKIINSKKIIQKLKNNQEIIAFSPRINFYGNIQSQKSTFQVDIYGVNPLQEKSVFGLYNFVTKGKYLDENQSNSIVLGQKLAEKLNVKLSSIIQLNFQNLEGKLISSKFKVMGIYKIANSAFEQTHVFVKKDNLQKVLNQKSDFTHQIAIKTYNFQEVQSISKNLKEQFKQAKIQTWQEVAPDLAYIEVMMQTFFLILIGIILLGLSMAILNTILMSVLERQSEFKMLLAIGMSKQKIFKLIIFETLFFILVALPLGLFLAWLSIYFSSKYGINLTQFSDGLANLGYDNKVYPSLSFWEYLQTTLLVFVVAFLSAIYPASKALN